MKDRFASAATSKRRSRSTAPNPTTPTPRAKAHSPASSIVEAIVNKQGEVEQVKVLKGLPMGLSEQAVEAVKKWRFRPGTLNGEPVDVIFSLTVNFTLE